jgi:hypothetical protein
MKIRDLASVITRFNCIEAWRKLKEQVAKKSSRNLLFGTDLNIRDFNILPSSLLGSLV